MMHKIIPLLVGLVLFGAACQKQGSPSTSTQGYTQLPPTQSGTYTNTTVSTNCPTTIQSPVNVSLATSILYPGQYRGNEYKSHGGFRFDSIHNNQVTVTLPLDAHIDRAARYIESGQVQYLFEFSHPCGLSYRLDHLLTLTPKFKAIADGLPTPTSSSQTTRLDPPPSVTAGETIATAVGIANNTFFDFGMSDTRHTNAAAQDPAYVTKHVDNPTAVYGICWFDLLPPVDAAKVKALPAGDQTSGKTSDYCQ